MGSTDKLDFYRDDGDKIYWVETNIKDDFRFSFDKKTIFDFWQDYPQKLTPEQRKIFDEENPLLAELKPD